MQRRRERRESGRAVVALLGDGSPLKYEFADGTVTIDLPAAKRTTLVDVVRVDLR